MKISLYFVVVLAMATVQSRDLEDVQDKEVEERGKYCDKMKVSKCRHKKTRSVNYFR